MADNNNNNDNSNGIENDSNNRVILREETHQPEGGVRDVEDDLTTLQILVETAQWDQVDARLKSNPEEILPMRSGPSALHLALEGGECPFPIMREMLELEPMLPSVVDRNGNTPLHIACGGEFAFDPMVLAMLLAAYPQATLLQDQTERTTPLHMLLLMGNPNLTCLQLLLDVAYSPVANLSVSYVLGLDFLTSPLENSVLIGQHFPNILIHVIREMAISDPLSFPAFLRPFLHLPYDQPKPKAVIEEGKTPPLLIRDVAKQVPLHIASRRGANAAVATMLLDSDRYPGAQEALTKKERKLRYPLHYAAAYTIPIDGAKVIFDHTPIEAMETKELYGLDPHQICHMGPQWTPQDRAMEIARPRNSKENAEDVSAKSFVRESSWNLFQHIRFYLRCKSERNYTSDWSILHAAAKIPSMPTFVRCLLKLYPWQLDEVDKDGMLPLHLACAVTRPLGVHERFWWLGGNVLPQHMEMMQFRLLPEDPTVDNTIYILTKAKPAAVRLLTPQYDLPLHLAICSGKSSNEGVSVLLEAAPLALATRNGTHHLYPFQLAAMKDNLDLTYNLLLANPMMVLSAIQ